METPDNYTQNWRERLRQAVQLCEDLTCVCLNSDFPSVLKVANRIEQILAGTRLDSVLQNLKIAASEENKINLDRALNDFHAIFLAMRINAFLRDPDNPI